MKIYVAGPYTRGDVDENVRNAITVGDKLRALGHTPFIPHLSHFWHLIIPHDYQYWMDYDIEWLMECDAVFRIEGDSKGADIEVHIAELYDMPIYRSYEDIPAGLK